AAGRGVRGPPSAGPEVLRRRRHELGRHAARPGRPARRADPDAGRPGGVAVGPCARPGVAEHGGRRQGGLTAASASRLPARVAAEAGVAPGAASTGGTAWTLAAEPDR